MSRRPPSFVMVTLLAALGSPALAQPPGVELGSVLIVGSDGSRAGTLVPDLDSPRGTALASDGTFFVSVTGLLGGPGGFVLKVNPDGSTEEFVSGVAPFDLEVDPVSGDLFIADALSSSILRTPTTSPASISTFASGFTPSGLGFAPSGHLFSGIQPAPGTTDLGQGGLAKIDPAGNVDVVGVMDFPFDVQVDSQGNVFANNFTSFPPMSGEVAFFPGLGAPGAATPATPLSKSTFAPVPIRGLGIGPVGTAIEDQVFASTAAYTIVTFDPYDPLTHDPNDPGAIFAGPPLSDIEDPYAFDIQFLQGGDFRILLAVNGLIPEPSTATLVLGAVVAFAASRRRAV